MINSSVHSVSIKKVNGQNNFSTNDLLAVEEPLEIRLIFFENGSKLQKSISVTMRTPGNDTELAKGFLFTEGVIKINDEVTRIFHDGPNIIHVEFNEQFRANLAKLNRHFYTTSSCGVCGKSSIDAIRVIADYEIPDKELKVDASVIYRLPRLLHEKQNIFNSTGSLHASALFDADGTMVLVKEDVGRHNALDKIIGASMDAPALSLSQCVLLLSGRASFELIQKAAIARIQIVAAVGAPSSLAVELAREFNITLIGFLRGERFNIYSGERRILSTD